MSICAAPTTVVLLSRETGISAAPLPPAARVHIPVFFLRSFVGQETPVLTGHICTSEESPQSLLVRLCIVEGTRPLVLDKLLPLTDREPPL